jgi:hypothetical protein
MQTTTTITVALTTTTTSTTTGTPTTTTTIPNVPGAPTNVQATSGASSAVVTFTAPSADGGSAIFGYTVTSIPGGIVSSSIESPITVTGLTNGTPYTFTVTATNEVGEGEASAPTNSVTPATVPGVPTGVQASAGNGKAVVSFTAPAENGGSPISSYTVTATPGGLTAKNWTSPITVTGLSNGTVYTFVVQATNKIGSGAESAVSNSVTPAAAATTTTTMTTTSTTSTTAATTTTTPSFDQPNSTIRIYLPDGENAEYWSINEAIKLKANYRDAEGFNLDVTPVANWSSSDSQIAEVGTGSISKSGNVLFKGNGEVRIFAFQNGLMDFMDFKVGAEEMAKHYGNLILLAGGRSNDDNDTLKTAIQYLCNRIYQVFKFRMFKDEDITYINHKTDQDFNGNGVADGIVDQSVKTVQALQQAMLWAAGQANDGPLYLYLMDHGYKNGTFQIDSNQVLTATQLDAMLDQFEEQSGRTSVVILEACYSGSFVSQLADTDRMIVASSSQDQFSFFSPDGTVSFGQFFSNRLMTGETWATAFDKAVADVTKIGPPYAAMNPQISIGSGVVMGKVYGDFTMGSLFPEIKKITPGASVNAALAHEFAVQLDMADTAGVQVWAMVTPPDYQPPTVSEEFTTPPLNLDKIDFISQTGSPEYTGSYTFSTNGAYTVTYYVKDSNGMVVSSPPQLFTVSGGEDGTTTTTAAVTTTTQSPATTTTTIPGSNSVTLPVGIGWNLLSSAIGVQASTLSGKDSAVISVWKWVDGAWAVYLPVENKQGPMPQARALSRFPLSTLARASG